MIGFDQFDGTGTPWRPSSPTRPTGSSASLSAHPVVPRPAADGWERQLDWYPADFPPPYAHQAEAFARLTSKDGHQPEPTLVTTGTGSGKTESCG